MIGRLNSNLDTVQKESGKKVIFELAVNRPYSDDEGNHPADFFPIVAWNKLADICEQYLCNGSLVLIKGRLQQDNDRKEINVVAESVNILEYKNKNKDKE